jgi:sugar phosphate isomerase/epimerase
MNFPGRSVAKEIHRIAEDGFDFLDLTLEPPAAWDIDAKEIGRLTGDLGLKVVGHTAWYLPLASTFPELRATARDLFRKGLDMFADAGVELVNVHPDRNVALANAEQTRKANAEAMAELAASAESRGIRLMIENLDRVFVRPEDFVELFEAAPDAGFHLDAGHANLNLGAGESYRLDRFLQMWGDRLVHVHLSDNKGGNQDAHLPLGAGAINFKEVAKALKKAGYDSTVTLEVFSREREHLRTSRRLWLEWWAAA